MEKIWLKSYPPDVPAEINPDIYQSLGEIFDKSCNEYGNLPAYYNLGVTLSYNEVRQLSLAFASFLQQVLHTAKGDRFAIMLPNILQYPIVMNAAFRIGVIIVNVNPLYTADELVHQINDSGAQTIIILENFAQVLEEALPRLPNLKNIIITRIGDLFPALKGWLMYIALKYFYKKIPQWHIPNAIRFKDALAQGKQHQLQPVTITNKDIAFLQYTGGTTGVSKGAILTHRNLIANILQADAWFTNILQVKQEIIITALPLYHIFSLTANCLYFSKIGGLNVLITNPRDIPKTISEMKKFKFTAITGVNTLFNALLKNPAFASLDFSKLRLSLGGGMAVQKAVADKWQELTHAPLLEAYGLTETSPCVTINPPTVKGFNGTIGLPVPSTEVAILDMEGKEMPFCEAGELAVKGPQVMQGYWQNPKETAKVFTSDGWLLTGDIASMNHEGFVKLLERKKDMILVSGFNVYPNEIEDVLARIPQIQEVAVIGVPDENTGEAVKAFIVLDKNAELSAEDVVKFARLHLTPYKVPKQIDFRQELPKTNVGKILRRALKSAFNG